MSDLILSASWRERDAKMRRRELRYLDETHAPHDGVFASLIDDAHAPLSDENMAVLDAMIDAQGLRNILKGLKHLLESRVDLDCYRMDSRYGRAAEVIGKALSHNHVSEV